MLKIREIKEICHNLGIRLSKRKGQNFLINHGVLERIVSAAELKKNDIILEIGPGFGILTEELAKKVKKVLAVEIDKKLVEILREKFKNQKNIEIVDGDILKFRISDFGFRNCDYKVVANLPYNITGIVLRKFLHPSEFHSDARIWPKPKLMVLMLQKEVAERILAKNKKESMLSLMVKFYGQPEIIRFVSKNNFWPRPKVDSTILRITRIDADRTLINADIDEDKFFRLIKIGFSSPRKQLINNLRKIIEKEKLKEIFEKLKINLKIRAEDLNLDDWLKIYKIVYSS